MCFPRSRPPWFLVFVLISVLESIHYAMAHETSSAEGGVGRRVLLSFRETPEGSNASFECSPSGPCVPCQYSEKNDEKYRCSETGYRIPLKCVQIGDESKDADAKKSQNDRSALEISFKHVTLLDAEEIAAAVKHRSLLDNSSKSRGVLQAYITYRSCIPAASEEKLSVFGFEGIVLFLLLISGSVVYSRKKGTIAMSGVGARIQSNSRF